MKTTLKISLAALLSVAACWSAAQTVSAMRGSEVPAVDKAPEIQPYLGSKPGGHALIPRTFQQQPPLVPHKVEGFDDITSEDNVCLDCHIHKEVRGQKIPQVKESHLDQTRQPRCPGDRQGALAVQFLPRTADRRQAPGGKRLQGQHRRQVTLTRAPAARYAPAPNTPRYCAPWQCPCPLARFFWAALKVSSAALGAIVG
jgi:cytochrome c-type protein NapB